MSTSPDNWKGLSQEEVIKGTIRNERVYISNHILYNNNNNVYINYTLLLFFIKGKIRNEYI